MPIDFDFPEHLAQGVYRKSGKPNAPENQNEAFKSGYTRGLLLDEDPSAVILEKWRLIGSPVEHTESFREWKRGYWAARFRALWSRIETNRHRA